MRSSVFIAILVLCACQKAAAPPSPAAASNARPATLADAEVATMTEELTELFDKVATAIERAGVDRDAVAIGINRVADAHSNPLERMGILSDPDVERRSSIWLDEHGGTTMTNARLMYEGHQPCADDLDVQAAIDRVTTKRHTPPPRPN